MPYRLITEPAINFFFEKANEFHLLYNLPRVSREVTKCPEESVQQCSNSLVVQTGQKTRRSSIGTICACVHALVCFHKILHMWTMLVEPADTVQTFSLLITWTVTAAVSAAVCWANAWPAYTKSLCRNARLLHAWHKSKYLHCRLLSAAGVMPRKSSTEWGELDQYCCFSLHVGTVLVHVFKGRCKVFKTQFRLFNV